MSFFHSNPYSTQVGQRIERATSEGNASEDWALNIEICDIINETDDGPKDGMKAIKKRLVGNRKWKEVMLSLTVLETCVKNCGHRFHVLACKQDFIKELVKLIQPNNNPPTCVQEKILSLIQSWADAFRGSSDLQGVVQVYTELKQKGIEFPATDLDSMSPIFTPGRTVADTRPAPVPQTGPTRQPSQHQPPPPQQQPMPQMMPPPQMMPAPQPGQPVQYAPPPGTQPVQYPQQGGPVAANPEQLAKLRSELDVVVGNVRVMSEMLNELSPTSASSSDVDLLQELNRTCRAMQQRVLELIDKVTNEEVTGELLQINDDLNNAFVRYDRFERYRVGQAGQQPQPTTTMVAQPSPDRPPAYTQDAPSQPQPPPPVAAPAEPVTGTLIDLGFDPAPQPAMPPPQPEPATIPLSSQTMAPVGGQPDLQQQLAGMTLSEGSVSSTLGQLNTTPATTQDEFDMFAQSRQVTYEDRGGSSYTDNTNIDQSGGLAGLVNSRAKPGQPINPASTDQLEEMEKWLHETDLENLEDNPENDKEPMTSSEFDRFLAERAAAADSLTDTATPTSQMQAAPAPSANRRGRQMLEESDNTMFGL